MQPLSCNPPNIQPAFFKLAWNFQKMSGNVLTGAGKESQKRRRSWIGRMRKRMWRGGGGEKRKTQANMEGKGARMRRGGLDGRW